MQVDTAQMTPSGSIKTGSHASNKDWSLPADFVQELIQCIDETTASILDRYNIPIKVEPTPVTAAAAPVSSPFMTALLNEPDTVTANNAPAFKSSKNPVVDLFWELGPTATASDLDLKLDLAWQHSPLDTLRIIWQARSIHEGKGIRESVFYHLIGFLYKEHPRTLIENLHLFVEKECSRTSLAVKVEEGVDELVERQGVSHGYFKDLLVILLLVMTKTLDASVTPATLALAINIGADSKIFSKYRQNDPASKIKKTTVRKKCYAFQAKQASKLSLSTWHNSYRTADKIKRNRMLQERFSDAIKSNNKFRALYLIVCKLFASAMKEDLIILEELNNVQPEQRYAVSSKLTLAGKWAPTPGRAHDKQLFISSAIATLLFPHIENMINRRITYQTKVLTPLRKALDVPEVKMAAGAWKEINYGRCASKCMARNKVQFFLHDEDRFVKYLDAVTKGKKKISGATLFPHELLIDSLETVVDTSLAPLIAKLEPVRAAALLKSMGSVTDSQWISLVQSLKDSSTSGIANSISVVDVSGSMGSLNHQQDKKRPSPIAVAVALGILTAQLAEPPFNGAFITFSAAPEIVTLQPGQGLGALAQNMVRATWGMNTAFDRVFDLLLGVAIKNEVKKEDMVKKVFVFSDMQFDSASGKAMAYYSGGGTTESWNRTIHQQMMKKFDDAGYNLPSIVYWNIQGEGGFTGTLPARADQPGVELISGYSASLLKSFLGMDGIGEEEEVTEEIKEVETEDDDDFEVVDEGAEGGSEEGKTDDAKEIKASKPKITPEQKLAKILSHPSFSKLRVLD